VSEDTTRGALLVNVASAALPPIGGFLVSILLAPYVGDANFGVYSLVMSAATFLLIVAKFGLHAATSRLVSEHDTAPGPWIRAGLALRLPLTLVVAVIAVVAAPWFAALFSDGEQAEIAFRLAGAVVLGASVFEFGTDLMVGLRAFRTQFVLRLATLLLRIAALLVVRAEDLGIVWFLIGHAVAQLVPASIALARSVAGTWTQRVPDGVRPMRRTWEIALPLAFGSASYLIYSHTDRLMLGFFHDDATVGQFSVARNVIDAALFPIVALAWTLRPALVRARRDASGTVTSRVLADGMRLSIVYGASGGILMATLGPTLLEGLYTSAFAPAGALLLWMIPLLVLRGLGTVVFPMLVAADAAGRYARLMGWTALVNAISNLILIPRLAAEGAILSTVLALGVLTVGGYRAVAGTGARIPWARVARPAMRAIVSAGLAGVAIVVLELDHHGLAVAAVTALVGTVALLAINVGHRGQGLRIDSGDVDGA